MQLRRCHNQNRERGASGTAGRPWSFPRARACVLLTLLAVQADTALAGQRAMQPPRPSKPFISPDSNHLPDANDLMEMRDQKAGQEDYAAANAERKKQIADDSANLLRLATGLKAEVDKTSKDTLWLDDIRRIDEIERLAHNVKEKMKLSMGAN
jgi:hypothetical protein